MTRNSRFPFWVWCFLVACFLWVFIFTGWLFARDVHAESQAKGISASLWAGYYLPKDPSFQEIYSDDGKLAGFLEFSKIWLNQIEATLGGGWIHFSGHTLDKHDDSSRDKATLDLAAGYFQCSYLFRYAREQKLIPYLGGGLDTWGYQEVKEDDETIKGVKYGYHGMAGIRFLLDWLDPLAAKSSSQEYGIENTYLVLEARWLKIDNFGENKLDLSGPLYRVGLLWEF
jgi:hypothetical protein